MTLGHLQHLLETETQEDVILGCIEEEASSLERLLGIVTHDCLQEEYVCLNDGTFRGLRTLGLGRAPGLSSWIQAEKTVEQKALENETPETRRLQFFVLDKVKGNFKIGESYTFFGITLDASTFLAVRWVRLNSVFDLTAAPSTLPHGSFNLMAIRANILQYLGLLFPDVQFCEYLLLLLLSKIYSRHVALLDVLNLGNLKAHINLKMTESCDAASAKSAAFVSLLQQFLAAIHPAVVPLEINLQALEDKHFVPVYDAILPIDDEEPGKLTSVPNAGALLLCPSTLLLIDETAMQPGKMHEQALVNFRLVQAFIDAQQLDVKFSEDYCLKVECNSPVLSVAINSTSLANANCGIKKCVDLDILDLKLIRQAQQAFLEERPSFLDEARAYLQAAAHVEPKFSEDLISQVETFFVKARKTDVSSCMGGEHLHDQLVLAKLVSVSLLHETVDGQHWRSALQLFNATSNTLTPN